MHRTSCLAAFAFLPLLPAQIAVGDIAVTGFSSTSIVP
jgi:hypothetical protein